MKKIKNLTQNLFTFFLVGMILVSISSYSQIPPSITIKGKVVDEEDVTLPGASIVLKANNKINTIADALGEFTITVPSGSVLVVSFISMETQEVTAKQTSGNMPLVITLKASSKQLAEVVVIGNIERKKESFTGAVATVSGSSLKQIGSQNLVESLKSLDPSFVVLENMAAGSNPNVLPTIEVRGQTSINISDVEDLYRMDPNQPLFILDGFETTLQKIVDLDYNRVASVSILKDAASTAFYGSRAANGVIVVETVKGQPGRYKFFYNGDYSVQVPDLTSYNMMNAQEKLQFELLSGRYSYNNGADITSTGAAQSQATLDLLYTQRLAEVQRGVNSYWMSDPLQAAFINRQSLRVSGGSNETMVDIGASYRNAPGVMKGSKRDTWTGDFDFTYNKGRLSFINQLGLSGYTAVESPYGAFSTWVGTNPYYRKTDENGEYPRYLDAVISNASGNAVSYNVANPLYNASLNSKNETTNIDVNERLKARWDFYKGMRLEGLFQLTTGSINIIRFTPPENTMYDDVDSDRRGAYYNSTQKNSSYLGNLMYIWNNSIGKHSYVINARGEISHQNTTITVWRADGYPYGTNGNPSFANNYPLDGKPTYQNTVYRRANFLASANYSFDNRYLFDATFRMDGSTVFGSEKKFTPFWSAGIGWNIHEEKFMQNVRWLNNLRLRATIGETGNQNLGAVVSTSIFSYLSGSNPFGPGITLSQLGNPYVEWQKTTTTNLALDLNMFDNRWVSKFEIYKKYTNPLVVSVDQASSTGVAQYPMSLGDLTYHGFEFETTYAFIRNNNVNWRVKLMGALLKGEYSGFSDKVEGMNKTAQQSNNLVRYRDGYSPKALWAVRSLGIDPATGQEVFLDKNDQPTFLYNSDDIKMVGIGEPDVTGTISSFFTYKRLSFTFILRYSLGEDIFNSALYNKVENISFADVAYNQDKRALYDRWQRLGDISEFKAISLTSTTPMSSRFVQTENYLSAESIGIMWRFEKDTWVRHLGMERLDLNATAGNLFRISNIKTERGTSYPFARTLSLSISVVF